MNGSNDPEEVRDTGYTTLIAEAMDDRGVVRVEYYDGEDLVASSNSAPWDVRVLYTSVDSGGHSLRAIAYDESDNTGESEVVPLSIAIVGGQIETMREDIGQAVWALAGAPRVTAGSDGSVFLATYTEDTKDVIRKYNSALILLWTQSPGLGAAGDLEVSPMGDQLILGYVPEEDAQNGTAWAIANLSSSVGATLQQRRFGFEMRSGLATFSGLKFSVTGGGSIYATTSLRHISLIDSTLATIEWTEVAAKGSGGVWSVAALSDGVALVEIGGDGCATTACVRRYIADGSLVWSRPLDDADTNYAPQVVGVGVGGIAVLQGTMSAVRLRVFDELGNETLQSEIQTGEPIAVNEVLVDQQGYLVVVGEKTGDIRKAWATRMDVGGTALWQTTWDAGSVNRRATDGAIATGGRFYVAGMDDEVAWGFGFEGPAWLAELTL